MGLFKKSGSKKDREEIASGYGAQSYGQPHNDAKADEAIHQHSANRSFKYAANLSKTQFNVGGLPVNVFGLQELTVASSRALAPAPPDVCIAIHMHGRGGSADNEEDIVRHTWDVVHRCKRQQQQSNDQREFLIVNFDARNHGHRKTEDRGQKGWKDGNNSHAFDLYSMIVGTAQDVSFLVDFLPSYLFPHDERKVVQWCITGKSLGGHAAWHVLANDPRISVGVPYISCPSFAALMAHRAPASFVTNGPPYVPHSLSALVASIDPASKPFDVPDASINPFYGKRICMCSGRQDKLVPWKCAAEFVNRLVVGPPAVQRHCFRVVLLDGVGHQVTEPMIEEAGQFIFIHAIDA